jgi:hypothetical protein
LHYEKSYELFSRESTEKNKMNQKENESQKPSEKQEKNWVPFEKVKQHVDDDLLPPFEELVKIGEPVDNDADRRIISLAVAGVLNTHSVPCRDLYDNAVFNNKRPKNAKSLSVNVVELPKTGNAVMHVHKDKVSHSMGQDTIELNAFTTKILLQSLQIFPRIFVLAHDHQMPTNYYNDLIFDALSVGSKRIGKNLIRQIYITDFYDNNKNRPASGANKTPEETELARRARHSVTEQRKTYRKITGKPMDVSNPIASTEDCKSDFVFSKKIGAERQRIYYDKHQEKERLRNKENYELNKKDTIRKTLLKQLNNGMKKRSKESTLSKYGIRCINGRYE